MNIDNKTTYIKREIMSKIAKVFLDDDIHEINRLPLQIIPRTAEPNRCCIEKDRNMVKHRSIAIMGFDVNDEDVIDNSLLSDYAFKAKERDKPEEPILTFIDEACKSCVRVNYYVTEVCRNCVAKSCVLNCPKKSIVIKNNQAYIDQSTCVNCGKCQKVCPFHAIVFVPVPCEESCPVGAIRKDSEGKQFIDYSKCIYCGKCIKSCPFGAIAEKSQIVDVISSIKRGEEITAMIAPATAGQFPVNILQIVTALKSLGFKNVVEVALGADITAENEAIEFSERISSGEPLMGTSCCPSYVAAVKKHAPDFEKYISHTKTPMYYTAIETAREYPGSKKVFIGPCISKKHEGFQSSEVDYVLTFEELGSLFIAAGIDIMRCEESKFDIKNASPEGRGFPVSGGVAQAVLSYGEKNRIEIKPVIINGLDKKNIMLLKAYGKGKCPGNLVEVMSCEGGCVAGPGSIGNPNICMSKIDEYKKIR